MLRATQTCTTHSCAVAADPTSLIAFDNPVSPSQRTMHTSAIPRDLSSETTVSQNLLD